MEDFTSDHFFKVLKPSTSCFSELNFNMDSINSHVHGLLDYVSSDIINSNNPNNFQPTCSNEPRYPSAEASGTHLSFFCPFNQTNAHVAQSVPSDFMEIPSSPGSGIDKDNGIIHGRKRKRKSKDGMEKAREVIHVRAKRGQATDSHSLAERVRRERINDKLRMLQDLVPGCYKTMGMAVMLDVIINYVQSLQNQIEFLSMKLSAASLFYDFNSPEAEALETLQRAARDCGDIPPRVHSTRPF